MEDHEIERLRAIYKELMAGKINLAMFKHLCEDVNADHCGVMKYFEHEKSIRYSAGLIRGKDKKDGLP